MFWSVGRAAYLGTELRYVAPSNALLLYNTSICTPRKELLIKHRKTGKKQIQRVCENGGNVRFCFF
jgi:hypothetical protein